MSQLETVKDRSCSSGGFSIKERSIGGCWSKGDVGLADPFLKISSHRRNHICMADVEVEKFKGILNSGSESGVNPDLVISVLGDAM